MAPGFCPVPRRPPKILDQRRNRWAIGDHPSFLQAGGAEQENDKLATLPGGRRGGLREREEEAISSKKLATLAV
jgi:hypothetical protein